MLITHDLALISEAVDRLYIMYAGKVTEEGVSAEFFGKPKHSSARVFWIPLQP